MSSFWQFFDSQMAIFRRVRSQLSVTQYHLISNILKELPQYKDTNTNLTSSVADLNIYTTAKSPSNRQKSPAKKSLTQDGKKETTRLSQAPSSVDNYASMTSQFSSKTQSLPAYYSSKPQPSTPREHSTNRAQTHPAEHVLRSETPPPEYATVQRRKQLQHRAVDDTYDVTHVAKGNNPAFRRSFPSSNSVETTISEPCRPGSARESTEIYGKRRGDRGGDIDSKVNFKNNEKQLHHELKDSKRDVRRDETESVGSSSRKPRLSDARVSSLTRSCDHVVKDTGATPTRVKGQTDPHVRPASAVSELANQKSGSPKHVVISDIVSVSISGISSPSPPPVYNPNYEKPNSILKRDSSLPRNDSLDLPPVGKKQVRTQIQTSFVSDEQPPKPQPQPQPQPPKASTPETETEIKIPEIPEILQTCPDSPPPPPPRTDSDTDSPPFITTPQPDITFETTSDSPKTTSESPKTTSDSPKTTSDSPKSASVKARKNTLTVDTGVLSPNSRHTSSSESPEWPSPPEPLTPQTPQTPNALGHISFDSDTIQRMLRSLPITPFETKVSQVKV